MARGMAPGDEAAPEGIAPQWVPVLFGPGHSQAQVALRVAQPVSEAGAATPPTAVQPAEDAQSGDRYVAVRRSPIARATAPAQTRSKRPFALLLTLLILFQANVVLQANRRYWDVQSDGYGALQRVQRCESLGSVPDVLYLGSSRAVYGVNPSLIDAQVAQSFGRQILGCNAAAFGSTFEEDYYTLKRFIEDGYTPKLVVENLWEYNLNINAPETADRSALAYDRVRTLADLTDVGAIVSAHETGWSTVPSAADFIAARSIPLYGDRIGLYKNICGNSTIGPCGAALPGVDPQELHDYQTADRLGFVPYYNKTLQESTPAELNAQITHLQQVYDISNRDFTIGGNQPGYLTQFVALARLHDVRLAFVVSPMHPLYFEYAFGQVSDWPLIASYWSEFALRAGVSYYDMSHAPAYTDADFEDPHHLNATGADMFSSWLAVNVVERQLYP